MEVTQKSLFINGQTNNTRFKLIYDSGSSLIPLLVPYELWTQLTESSANDIRNDLIDASGIGGNYHLVGNRMKGGFQLGDISFENPMVYFEQSDQIPFKDLGSDGLIGNRLFLEEFIIGLDFNKGWMTLER